MNGTTFQQECMQEIEARRLARRVLGVGDGASQREVRRAWRRRCLETHPDRNPGDPHAEQSFQLVNCAYRLLIDGIPCDELLAHGVEPERSTNYRKHDLSNAWGFYLWWREKFF